MAKSCIIALVSFTVVACAAAEGFLARSQLRREDVKQMLLSELSGHHADRLAKIEDELRPMFTALPKSETGKLEQSTVRYALHRYFLHQYGWFVQGFDNAGEAWNASGSSTVLKAFAPMYIQGLIEDHLHGQGMGLHELAVFAATVADLIHAEAIGKLQGIYSALQLPTVGPVERVQAELALSSYVSVFLTMNDIVATNAAEIQAVSEQLEEAYPNLNETKVWLQDQRHTFDFQQSSSRNPFVEREASFDDTVAFAVEFGHNFGSFQNLECHTLKRKLSDMEHLGTGRVLLSKFYANALEGSWEFMESVEYLRNQGALDETVPDSPSVVIANYMNSRMNCLTASEYYAVCCLNECDELLGRLEAQIEAPGATPNRIVEVVSKLPSDTVDAPRNISDALTERLREIAQHHGGQVPLHGRMFAQWLHHAYPRECPFPHVAGAVKPMYPDQWAEAMGEDLVEVSQAVMEQHAARASLNETEIRPAVLPWTFQEELVAEHRFGILGRMPGSEKRSSSPLRPVLAMAVLVSFAVPLARSFKVAFAGSTEAKAEQHLV